MRSIFSLHSSAEEVPLASLPPPVAGECSMHIIVGCQWLAECVVIVCIVHSIRTNGDGEGGAEETAATKTAHP